MFNSDSPSVNPNAAARDSTRFPTASGDSRSPHECVLTNGGRDRRRVSGRTANQRLRTRHVGSSSGTRSFDTFSPLGVRFVSLDADSKRTEVVFHPLELPVAVRFGNVLIVGKDIPHTEITELTDTDSRLSKQSEDCSFERMTSRPDQPAHFLDRREPAFVLGFAVRVVHVLLVRICMARPTDRHQVRRSVRPTSMERHDVMHFEVRLRTTVATLAAVSGEDFLSQSIPQGGV